MFQTGNIDRLNIASNGDLSLYEDTGTTPKFFWDASAESLGIGTSSAYRKLTVSGSPVSVGGDGTGVIAALVNDTTAYNASPTIGLSFWNKVTSGGNEFPSAVIQAGKSNTTTGDYSGYLSFQTTDAGATSNEAMRIDASGNVGINNSNPSAFDSLGGKYLVVGNGVNTSNLTLFSDDTADGNGYGHVAFADSAVSGSTAQYAGLIQYYHGEDSMRFYTNATEKMRIDASGTLLVGRTGSSGLGKLNVEGGADFTGGDVYLCRDSGSVGIGCTPTTALDVSGAVTVTRSDVADDHSTISNEGGQFIISAATGGGGGTYPMLFKTAATERMRINSDGSVDVGAVANQTSAVLNARFNGAAIEFGHGNNGAGYYGTAGSYGNNGQPYIGFSCYSQENLNLFTTTGAKGNIITGDLSGNLTFAQVTTATAVDQSPENRMTLDASGNLLVGKTAASFTVLGAELRNSGQINSASTLDFLNMYSTSASAYRFYVTNAGQINATSTSISAISDQRFKENIRDLDDGLSKVMQLKPRKFDWKEGKGADTKDARGFIAQEFEEVFPDLIAEWKDPAPEGEEPYKSVSQDLIPTLVKAIQEQQAIIEALTARIAALES